MCPTDVETLIKSCTELKNIFSSFFSSVHWYFSGGVPMTLIAEPTIVNLQNPQNISC